MHDGIEVEVCLSEFDSPPNEDCSSVKISLMFFNENRMAARLYHEVELDLAFDKWGVVGPVTFDFDEMIQRGRDFGRHVLALAEDKLTEIACLEIDFLPDEEVELVLFIPGCLRGYEATVKASSLSDFISPE